MNAWEEDEAPEHVMPLGDLIGIYVTGILLVLVGWTAGSLHTQEQLADDWAVETSGAWEKLAELKTPVDSILKYEGDCRVVHRYPWVGIDTVAITKFCYKAPDSVEVEG